MMHSSETELTAAATTTAVHRHLLQLLGNVSLGLFQDTQKLPGRLGIVSREVRV